MSGLLSFDPAHHYQTACSPLTSSPPQHFAHELKLSNAVSSARITRLELTAFRFTDTVLSGILPRVHFAIISLNVVKLLVAAMWELMVNLSVIWSRVMLSDFSSIQQTAQ